MGLGPGPLIDDVLTEGWKAPNGKLVVGHDAQHFSLKFLAALAANPVPNEYSNMAQAFMWRYASIVGGWLRTEYYQSLHSSREVGRLLDFVADVIDVAWMEPEDAVAIINGRATRSCRRSIPTAPATSTTPETKDTSRSPIWARSPIRILGKTD